MESKKILAVNVHPNINGKHTTGDISPSIANKLIMSTISEHTQFTCHNIIEAYPDLIFDQDREKDLLSNHDTLLIIGPIYWYTLPGIAKKWLDEVFTYGWAYGSKGNALKGKNVQLVLTSGSDENEYSPNDIGNTVSEFFINYQRSFEYCKMNWLSIRFIGELGSSDIKKDPSAAKNRVVAFSNAIIKEHIYP